MIYPNIWLKDFIVQHLIYKLSYGDVKKLPLKAQILPGYANWTDESWKLHLHGNVFYDAHLSNHTLDKWAHFLTLFQAKAWDLPRQERDHVRNTTQELITITAPSDSLGSLSISASNTSNPAILPVPSISYTGSFEGWVPLKGVDGLINGDDAGSKIQRVEMGLMLANDANATNFLVPEHGITVLSDVDDILRVGQIWRIFHMIRDVFVKDFSPWMNMPEIYQDMLAAMPDAHFHYLTTCPQFLARKYIQFLWSHYPVGSLDTHPWDFTHFAPIAFPRKFLLDRIFRTFPKRKFILVGDSSNQDVMIGYPELLRKHPDQVQCILMRNTTATEKSDWYKYSPKHFKGLDRSKFMFFKLPDDLKGIDFAHGGCVNSSVVTDLNDHGNPVTQGFKVLWWRILCHFTHAVDLGCPEKKDRK
ncbi:MAG: hypothetical protein M1820_001488 [Bogoriella megaspora]|nr:MAG: hypothetical protein M1820_001488 [Bogoriella megaspora]